jgi:hypothetical protein
MTESSGNASGTSEAPVGRVGLVAGTSIAVAGTFLFRFLTVSFTNDHFVHLTRGWQILQGDIPDVDFFDPGLVGQYYTSAAALAWSGHNLFGEAIVTVAFIAAAAGLTFLAAARLSGSLWLAAAATTAAVISMPRLYSYPKVFFYVLAIVAAWRYAHRPGRRNLVWLAVVTVVAFLFRHDHGVYIGVAAVAMLTVLHWGQARDVVAALARYSAVTALLMLPFLVFVQVTVGLLRYTDDVGAPPLQFNLMRFQIDPSAPWVVVPPPSGPRVNVRWRDDIDDAARLELERRHDLHNPRHVEDSTWSYVPANIDESHLSALVGDPAVADTHGIDRAAFAVTEPPPLYLRLQRRFPVLRMQVAPGILSPGNAFTWFYYVTFLLPFMGLLLVALLLWKGRIGRPEAAVACMASVLCLIVVQTLVRASPDSRLPDVANVTAVLGAWVSARLLDAGAGPGRLARRAWTVAVAAMVIATLWSVWTFAEASASLETSRLLTGPAGVLKRMQTVSTNLHTRPIDNWTRESPGLGGLVRYVFECTAATDRLLVTWFAPEVFFQAERAFAGGQVYLMPRWHSSPADQRLTIERLERQRVPIVLEKTGEDYASYFPLVADYLRDRYRSVPIQGESMRDFRMLVDTRLTPTGTYEPLGTPCYR